MDSDLYNTEKINDINLENYFPYEYSYNSVVYVHKRFLDDVKEEKTEKKNSDNKKKKVKKPKKFKDTLKLDKGQQFNGNLYLNSQGRHEVRENNESVLEHTIQFVKNIVPLVIPEKRDRSPSPVIYTIKASKKYKKKTQKPHVNLERHDTVTFRKEQSKEVMETFRNEKVSQVESLSVKETLSISSNTLDEIMDPSQCGSYSEISTKKHTRKVKDEKKNKHKDLQKFDASESFEALATRALNKSGVDTKIKIHLMNEAEKSLLAENIRIPILNTIRECLSQLNSIKDTNTEIVTVKKTVKCNSQKLDNILDKITCIERRLCDIDKSAKAKSPQAPVKASTQEQLGEDLRLKQVSSDEEYYMERSELKKAGDKNVAVLLTPRYRYGDGSKREDTGAGEEIDLDNASSSQLGVKHDRLTRIPARFCWTDARKNDGKES